MKDVTIMNDCILYKGNQIGFFEDKNTILLCVTDEDFENGEFSNLEINDVKQNLVQIETYLKSLGHSIIKY